MRKMLDPRAWMLLALVVVVAGALAPHGLGQRTETEILGAPNIDRSAHGWLLPDNISEEGKPIDTLFWVIFGLTGFVFLLTEGLLVLFIVKYRRREGQKALYTHGNHKLEVVWTVIPAIILIVIAVAQIPTWRELKDADYYPLDDPEVHQVHVMAQQFAWRFRYPGPDREFFTDDDFTSGKLIVPEGAPVVLSMRSLDVIHSLFIPHVRFKQDVVPGLTTQGWFTAHVDADPSDDQRWWYPIACAELCGVQHYTMKTYLRVVPREQWDAVYAELSASGSPVDYKSLEENFRFWQAGD